MELQETDLIENKITNSGLVTIDLELLCHSGERILFDLKNWLFRGIILKEKDSFQRVSSSRSPSASRASRRATRWSSQKPGASIAASISARRAAFVTGSKTPRGRLDAAEQVPQGGGVDAHPAPLPSRTAAPTGDSLLALCAMALLVFLPRAAGARVIPANASGRHNRRLWRWG